MPALAAKKRPACSPADLHAEIERILVEIDAYVESRVAALKASPTGRDLPVQQLRMMFVRGDCPCRAALRLISENN